MLTVENMARNWKSFKLHLTAISATEKPDKQKLALLLPISESLLIVLMHYTDRIRRKVIATAFGFFFFFINPQNLLLGVTHNAEMFYHISGLHFFREWILFSHCQAF